MKTLYLDIETLPAEESYKDEIRTGEALSRSKRKELQDRGRPLSEHEVESLYRDTALAGEFGRIFCVGVRLDPEDREARILDGEEPRILREFWALAKKAELFVGHNLLNFDLRFIFKRSVVHRVRPSREISLARYQSRPVFDTMHEWSRWGGEFISLDRLSRVLDLPSSKKELSGDKVYDAFLRGEHERIKEYCKADVELTRLVHRRLAYLD